MKAILEINGFQKIIDIPRIERYIKMFFEWPMVVYSVSEKELEKCCTEKEIQEKIIIFELQHDPVGNFLYYLPNRVL